jgi:hydrogenase maturation protease
VELLTDFQLQVEYALDLQGRRQVVFVDASLDAPAPFSFTPALAVADASYSSHELSPGAVLHAYEKLFGEPPPAYVLAIRGEAFELGEDLSTAASVNLEAALSFIRQRFFDTCS